MLILLGITALFVVAGIFFINKDHIWDTAPLGAILLIISIILFLVSISIPFNQLEVKAGIHEFKATQATIDRARQNGTDLEDAAIQQKVIESNQWLANQQYYNSSIFGWWIPSEVDELKPIQ